MWRVLASVAVVALAAAAAGPLGGSLVAWEMVVGAALFTVAWRWRLHPGRVGALWADPPITATTPHALGALELEVAGASDEQLGGDSRIRLRLVRLIEGRAGLGRPATKAEITRLLGADASALLYSDEAVIDPDALEELVRRIEEL